MVHNDYCMHERHAVSAKVELEGGGVFSLMAKVRSSIFCSWSRLLAAGPTNFASCFKDKLMQPQVRLTPCGTIGHTQFDGVSGCL